jgi:hypothetical protein
MSLSITSNHLDKHTSATKEQRRYLPKHISTLSREQPLPTAISSPIEASPLIIFALVLIAAMKRVAMVILASIQITFSAAAPLTTAATIDQEHGLADIHTTATTFVTLPIVSNVNALAGSIDTFTINSSNYIAAHRPTSAAPIYANQTYTLADKTGTDLPSSISTKGIKYAPLATLRRPNKSSAAVTANQLVPRMIIGPNEIPMTTMKGVTSSVPYLRYTKKKSRSRPSLHSLKPAQRPLRCPACPVSLTPPAPPVLRPPAARTLVPTRALSGTDRLSPPLSLFRAFWPLVGRLASFCTGVRSSRDRV